MRLHDSPWVRQACSLDRKGFQVATHRLRCFALACDALLTPYRLRFYPLSVMVITFFVYATATLTGDRPFDAFGNPLATDLTAHVTAGRIVLDGDRHRLYDVFYQWTVQQELLGGSHKEYLNIYLSPPFVAYLYAPFAALPYLVAAGLWTVVTIALLGLSFYLLWPLVPNLHRYGYGLVLLLMFSAPPVFELLGDGQDSAISLLLFIGGLRLLLARRDLMAGGVLGLGMFKPQLFLLMPMLLLFQRRWRALAGYAVVASALVALSIVLMGLEGTRSYVNLLTSDIYRSEIVADRGWKMQSLVALGRGLLPGSLATFAEVTAVVAGTPLLALLAHCTRYPARNSTDFTLLYTLTVLATGILNPHFFLYDYVIVLLPAFLLLNEVPRHYIVRLSLAAAYVLTFSVPIRHLIFGKAPWPLAALGAPWAVLPLIALLVISWRLLRQGSVSESHPLSRMSPK